VQLNRLRLPDAKGKARTWSQFYCHAGRETLVLPHCTGKQHSCELAPLLFHKFRDVYEPVPQVSEGDHGLSSIAKPEFPYAVFHLDSKFPNLQQRMTPFVSNLLKHMREGVEKKQHMMWLVEVQPSHAFIIEQGSPEPGDFRLYQSWMHGFDINYWLDADDLRLCYKFNWGEFGEQKYDKEKDTGVAMEKDLKMVQSAKDKFGRHRTFDESIFEEIFTKLAFGWKLIEDGRMEVLHLFNYEDTKHLDVIANREEWSLRHIFGLEPIQLKLMEENPQDFAITVQVVNLGTTDDFQSIVPRPGTLESDVYSSSKDVPPNIHPDTSLPLIDLLEPLTPKRRRKKLVQTLKELLKEESDKKRSASKEKSKGSDRSKLPDESIIEPPQFGEKSPRSGQKGEKAPKSPPDAKDDPPEH